MVTLRDSLPGRMGWTAARRPDAARSRRCPGGAVDDEHGPIWRGAVGCGGPLRSPAAGVAATVMPDAAAGAAVIAAAILAVRLHAVTFTVHREGEVAVRGRCRQMPGYGPA